ncbi:MauE/DoxX family redox-associated membrane protein [Desertivirga xinjiangensis]|uniref:MauE/DoxX family redox-associated membrane protein n=1 Tax=Desertivirga xinjiangensis TaxID=539206 RepID=UPI00210BA2AC|nr:MauE/DoxX family redox-associated membrane protein [Pedobacter xinjiangensis]
MLKDLHKKNSLSLIIFLLVLLWTYAAMAKLLDFESSKNQMLSQVFPKNISIALAWLVPLTELITAALLCFTRTVKAGLIISLGLISAFSIYILLIITGLFGQVPCSCGGIIEKLSWGQHLVFNLFFTGISIAGILLTSAKIRHPEPHEVPL